MAKSKAYWIKRQKQWIKNQDREDDKVAAKLRIQYRKTSKELEKDISSYFQRYGEDNVIEFKTLMKGLSKEDRDLLFQNMEEFAKKYPEYSHLMPVRESVYKLNRLQGLHYSTQMQLLELGAIEQKELEKHLEKTYGKHYKEVMKELGVGSEFLAANSDLMKDTIYSTWVNKANFSDRIWNNKDDLMNHLRTKYRDGLSRGDNYDSLVKEVMKRFDVGYNDTRRLVWTEASFVLNQSHTHAYQNAGIEEYEINAIMDNKTSVICRDLDGEKFAFADMEVGVNFPPFHPWCRTTFVASIPEDTSEKDLKKKAEENAGKGTGRVKFNDGIKGNMTTEQAETLEGILEKSPEDVQRLWNDVQGDLVTADSNSKNSYYRRGEGVYFNFDKDSANEQLKDRRGNLIKGKANYTTFFHEYGHHIDSLFGKEEMKKVKSKLGRKTVTVDVKTWSYRSKELGLSESLKSEVKETMKEFDAKNIDDLSKKLYAYAQENYPYGYSGVSDIISGLTKGRTNFGWGHERKYWRGQNDGLGKEAFAHMFAAHAMRGEADKLMKKVFPKSYKKAKGFIKEAGR